MVLFVEWVVLVQIVGSRTKGTQNLGLLAGADVCCRRDGDMEGHAGDPGRELVLRQSET